MDFDWNFLKREPNAVHSEASGELGGGELYQKLIQVESIDLRMVIIIISLCHLFYFYLSLLHQRQRLRPARQPAPYRDSFGSKSKEDEADNDDAPHFREIPEKESSDYEVSVNFLPT